MEGLLESSVPIAEAPELGARRLDDQDQALAVCQSVGLLLRLGGGDLELCQHRRFPGFSGSIQQTQMSLFLWLFCRKQLDQHGRLPAIVDEILL